MPDHPQLRAHLTLERPALGGWRASVTFHNVSPDAAHIVKWNVPTAGGALSNNVFEVVKPGAKPSRYLGERSKRRPPAGDDFIVLAADAERTFVADLSAFYDVPSGGDVLIWYEAFHDIPGREGVFLVKSNAVATDS